MRVTKSDVNHFLDRVNALHPSHKFELESAYEGHRITSAPKDCDTGACSDFCSRGSLRHVYDIALAMFNVLTMTPATQAKELKRSLLLCDDFASQSRVIECLRNNIGINGVIWNVQTIAEPFNEQFPTVTTMRDGSTIVFTGYEVIA